ncbi:DUF3265 domain-containing protein [Vibrio parahaemolyticus]|nr:DUF3265 domain-containing protein [Vibrio parahaemolyticus]
MRWATNKQFKSDSARVAFYYALVLVIKVVCGSIVLRASHLNWALCVSAWKGIQFEKSINGCSGKTR